MPFLVEVDEFVRAHQARQLFKLIDANTDARGDRQQIVQVFRESFFDITAEDAILWSLTDVLTSVDLPTLRKEIIDSFLKHKRSKVHRSIIHRKCFSYLAGLLRLQDEEVHEFLVTTALAQARDSRLASLAIQALGRIGRPGDKERLEEIAAGRLDETMPALARSWESAKGKPAAMARRDQVYLRQRAIDSLAELGDEKTIQRLRAVTQPVEVGYDQEDLQHALNRTIEAIYWRLNWRAEG